MANHPIKIILIHGFMAREHMQRHLCHFLKAQGYADTAVYGHRHSVVELAREIRHAKREGQAVAMIGFSQGGFHAVRLARYLAKYHIQIDLLVMMAAGGLGRILPTQWGFNPRQIPQNVVKTLNYFAIGDHLGSDPIVQHNHIVATQPQQHIENIVFERELHISHIDLSRCYPEQRVHPELKQRLHDRVLTELALLNVR